MTALADAVFELAAEARIAAQRDGWRPHPADRDLYVRGLRRIRLTQTGRKAWCWSEVKP